MGPSGAGKFSVVKKFLEERAAKEKTPPDWCYVYNFEEAHRPRYLQFPPGRAREFHRDMEQLVQGLEAAIPGAFESEEYRQRRQEIEEEYSNRHEEAINDIRARAKEEKIALVRTPSGMAFAPVRDDEVMPPDEYAKLPDEERKKIEGVIDGFQDELSKILRQRMRWKREMQARIKKIVGEMVEGAIPGLFEEIRKKYDDLSDVARYLDAVRKDVIEHADQFHQSKDGEPLALLGLQVPQQHETGETILRRYRVNVIVDHGKAKGAPVIYEDNPTFQNLLGHIEHIAQMGALVTDFTLIKPGALHRANGGYLILDTMKVLFQPYAWEALKRALRSGEIRTESIGQMLSLISTVSLEPDPIPLKVKIVLVGDRLLYYLLHQHDPDFADCFKVAADFEEDMDRGRRSMTLYARLIASLVRDSKLLPFDREAVARVIEHASRLAGDARKMCVRMRSLKDTLRESDYWARERGESVARVGDVQKAIDMQTHRHDRLRARLREEVARGMILIDTDGAKVGQVNGLSVLQLGATMFGNPSRITARARMGPGRLVDIEREVELGGPLHSKGVLIIGGFLAGRYLPDRPLSISATLVFEQNYGGVDGDSASSAELYSLLSALAEAPLSQSLAVTGSVNQHGEVQAIGGVNDKIEGFFDVCRQRRLTGRQGVIIPAANAPQLMLRKDVVDAVRAGRFHIYSVRTIDEGIELLTGLPAGERDASGKFPDGSINARVEARLRDFSERAGASARSDDGENKKK